MIPPARTMRRRRSLVRRLFVSVNIALAVVLGGFAVLDYELEWRTHLAEKRTAMREEARTLLSAVEHLRSSGLDAVQVMIDEVCGAMRVSTSPGHHIVAILGDEVVQARVHHRASSEILDAMKVASRSGLARIGDEYLVAGTASDGRVTIYVSEYISNIRRLLRWQMFRRTAGIIVAGLAIAVAVNLLLHRWLKRPLDRMVKTVRTLAGGDLSARMPRMDTSELALLADEFDVMAARLEAVERARRRRMDRAKRIQQNLLPGAFDVPGARCVVLFRPAADVAGDYYDIVALPGWAILFCVADVSGHDVPAALCAAMLKAFINEAVEHESDPASIMQRVNSAFLRVTLDEDFATMLLARWDPAAGALDLVSAGHEMAYLLRRDSDVAEIAATGPPLGIDETVHWDDVELKVASGDRLVMLTDGLPEMRSRSGEHFGRGRVHAILEGARDASLDDLRDRVLAAISSFSGSMPREDDVTLLAVEFVE